MSTVILTPTHIAGDHAFVNETIDKRVVVDINRKKVFLDPTLRFILGLTGNINGDQIDHPVTYDALHYLLDRLEEPNVKKTKKGDPFFLFTEDERFEHLSKVIHVDVLHILVTATQRYGMYLSKDKNLIGLAYLSPYFGIGTGGGYAAGLLIGGTKLSDIWPIVNKLDPLTSQEYTAIPLDILVKGLDSNV